MSDGIPVTVTPPSEGEPIDDPPEIIDHSHSPPPLPPPDVDRDPCSALLGCFPLPGEIWTHLCATGNHYRHCDVCYTFTLCCPPPQPHYVFYTHRSETQAILANHRPPCHPCQPPVLLNAWPHAMTTAAKEASCQQQQSPYRIQYGLANPATRGVILTHNTVIPNLSFTPRLAVNTDVLENLLNQEPERWPDPILVVPAVHGRVLRVFHHNDHWYLASNHRLQRVDATDNDAIASGHLVRLMETCLARYRVHSVEHLVRDLDRTHCWFFAVYPGRNTLMFLGTCRVVTHTEIRGDSLCALDLGFALHRSLPSNIPILPTTLSPTSAKRFIHEEWHNLRTLQYTDLFDGLLLVNRRTMFAVRLMYPALVYLTPLLRHQQPLSEFLVHRCLQARLLPSADPTIDHATITWYQCLEGMTDDFFGFHHGPLIHRIRWQVHSLLDWLPIWVVSVNAMSWDEWNQLDDDLQRLFVLLDHEAPCRWHTKILCNAKYMPWLARLIVLCLRQWEEVQPPTSSGAPHPRVGPAWDRALRRPGMPPPPSVFHPNCVQDYDHTMMGSPPMDSDAVFAQEEDDGDTSDSQ